MDKFISILKVIGAAAAIFATAALAFNLYIMWKISPVTAVSDYQHAKDKRWVRPDLVEHFPAQIPANAKNPEMFYRQGYLQGGSTIELRIAMPAQFIETEISKAKGRARISIKGDENIDTAAGNPDMIPKWSFWTYPQESFDPEDGIGRLPGDFTIYLLRSKPYKTEPVSWNHGEAAGVAISKERNEIIYWAEDW